MGGCTVKTKGIIMKKLMGLVALMFLTACGGVAVKEEAKKEVINTNFYQHWVHSYEEQNGDKKINIFRPKGSRDFPAARFRMEFAFDTSGQCVYKFLSPTDRHELRNCVYTKIGNKVYLYNEDGKLLSHLGFTLSSTTTADMMKMSYGIAKPVAKENKAKKKDG